MPIGHTDKCSINRCAECEGIQSKAHRAKTGHTSRYECDCPFGEAQRRLDRMRSELRDSCAPIEFGVSLPSGAVAQVCGRCCALVLEAYFDSHVEWHIEKGI